LIIKCIADDLILIMVLNCVIILSWLIYNISKLWMIEVEKIHQWIELMSLRRLNTPYVLKGMKEEENEENSWTKNLDVSEANIGSASLLGVIFSQIKFTNWSSSALLTN
jgi:hypothetical protein